MEEMKTEEEMQGIKFFSVRFPTSLGLEKVLFHPLLPLEINCLFSTRAYFRFLSI